MKHAHSTAEMDVADSFTQRAVDVLTSDRVADAMTFANKDPRLVARDKRSAHQYRRSDGLSWPSHPGQEWPDYISIPDTY